MKTEMKKLSVFAITEAIIRYSFRPVFIALPAVLVVLGLYFLTGFESMTVIWGVSILSIFAILCALVGFVAIVVQNVVDDTTIEEEE